MASFKIYNPFQFFTDASGYPLDAGYVYIGTAGLNPETNPIAVYWDSAMTIPAAQPIRTVSGYPSRNGKMANIYVSATSFSVTVKDKNSRLVAFESSYSSALQSGDVTFSYDTTYTQGTVGHRLSRVIDVTCDPYNVVADDDSYGASNITGIAAAIADMTDGCTLVFPKGTIALDDSGGQVRPGGTSAPSGTTPTLFTLANLNDIAFAGNARLKLLRNGVCNWHFFQLNSCTNVKVAGLSFEGNREPDLTQINYNGEAGEVFRLSNCQHVNIYGNFFTKTSITPIRVQADSYDININNNIYYDGNDCFVLVGDGTSAALENDPHHVNICDNIIDQFYTDCGIKVRYSAHNVVIDGNTVIAYQGGLTQNPGALMVRGYSSREGAVTDIVVTNNILDSVAAYTVSMLDTLSSNARYPQNVKFEGNKILGNVLLKGTDIELKNNEIDGVVVQSLAGNVDISKNKIRYAAGGTARAVDVSVTGDYRATVEDNEITTDSTGHTIYVANANKTNINRNKIWKDGATTGISNAIEVYVPASGIASICDNEVFNESSYRLANGVRISATGSGSMTTIRDNTIVNAGSYSFNLTSGCTAGTVRLLGNTSVTPTTGALNNAANGATVELETTNNFPAKIGADVGDAATTVTSGSTAYLVRYNTPITAHRAVTLSTTGATLGDKHRILRTAAATGGFNVNVGTGPLRALGSAGTWCDVEYDGSAWILTGYGTL